MTIATLQLTETEFRSRIEHAIGTPPVRYRAIGGGRYRRRQAVPKKSGCEWAAATVNLRARRVHLMVYLNIEPKGLAPRQVAHLKNLIQTGISRYWSREIILASQTFAVNVAVRFRPKQAMDVRLRVEQSAQYARSHNSGIVQAVFIYNEGFFSNNRIAADVNFQLVCAHEFGHSVLEYTGGKGLSWGHKGSTHALLQSVKRSTPGYPLEGEIDLMSYYDSDKQALPRRDIAARSRADQTDLKRLIWMSEVRFED